ncbi:hypothetical protein NJT12_21035 [Flavobacterium sp. AC]|uniref:Substrate import-associated zinc metallohydrolase lipoprotein n=1 Tax=Flavobacterium azizsancarii TaxID=2961580 RepID=A0ABT4WI41_9FLAO|nr:hypothetical protein [Flavobacterium azizsancarii]MDA6072116.1 hypothetical protein [Flavobacterium azizsancarii]
MKKKIITPVFTILFLLSCTNDHNNTTQEMDFTKDIAKEWYNSKFKKSIEWNENNESDNMVPDWNNATFRKLDGLEVIEFPLVQKDAKIKSSDSKELNTLMKIAFIKTANDSIVARKFYYVAETNYFNSKQLQKKENSLEIYNNNFKGLLITKKWNNQILSYKKIDKNFIGVLELPVDFKNTRKTNQLASGVPTSEDPSYYIQLNSVDIIGGKRRYFYYFNPITFKTDLYKESYFNNNTYQQNGYYYPLTTNSTPAAVVSTAQYIESTIISSALDPCKNTVLQKLKNTSDIDIANLFTVLGATTKIKVTFINAYPLDDKSQLSGAVASTARTNKETPYDYTIRMNPDYTHNNLSIATVMLHELVHAYFLSFTDNPSKTNSFPLDNYPILFQAYCDKRYPPKNGESPSLHHAEMANSYVQAMGKALQEFQTGQPAVNGIPDQLYLDLAWAGLRDTPIYEQTYPLGSPERDRIENRYYAEIRNGYSGGYYPIGTKCN